MGVWVLETSAVLVQLTSNHLFPQVSIEDIRDRVVVLSHESMTADDFEILVNSDITEHSIRL